MCLGLQESTVETEESYQFSSATAHLSWRVQSGASAESFLEGPAVSCVKSLNSPQAES